MNTVEFIKKSQIIHNYKYDYLKAHYINSKTKIIITCKIHGEFLQRPDHHLNKHGCMKCSGNKKLTQLEFIKRSAKIHNNKYDYSKTQYINSSTKIKIICNDHKSQFIFLQLPTNHLSGKGCPKCSKKLKLTNKDFINKAKEIHKNKYDYSKVIYKNNKTKVKIICKIHGSFFQAPIKHLFGKQGCSECFGNKKKDNLLFIKNARKIHNNKYDYSSVIYKNNKHKIKIICKNHVSDFMFLQTPDNHLKGKGCPRCSKRISKPETKWLDSLNIKKSNRQVSLSGLSNNIKVDGYDPETNTVYEFYGDFWHGNPNIYNKNSTNPVCKKTYGELYQEVLKKEFVIKNAGYNLVTIWEEDFKKDK